MLQDDVDAFLEESVVRRELSDNYCFYVPNYDSLDACYDWAKDSLNKHRSDKREHVYTLYASPSSVSKHCVYSPPQSSQALQPILITSTCLAPYRVCS